MKTGFKMSPKRQFGITLHSIAKARVAPVVLLVACAAMVLSAIPAPAQIPYGPDSTISVPVDSGTGAGTHTGSLIPTNITIIPTFDTSITSDPSAGTIEAGINAAISRVEADISNPITVNITFQEGGGLGGSSTFIGTVSYASYLSALQNNQTLSANDVTAIATLGAGPNNPVNGNANVFLTTPLLRALGFNANVASDCTISLNTSIMNLSRTGAQNPGFYDLQAVAGHEIDEALGIGGPGSALPTTNSSVGALDLFRYSGPGVRSFTTSTSPTSFFSINGGITDLVHFNQTGGGADYSDWGNPGGTGSGNSPPQVQDAFGTPGAIVNLGANELTALDVVGYNLAPVPEPGSLAILAAAVAAALLLRRRLA